MRNELKKDQNQAYEEEKIKYFGQGAVNQDGTWTIKDNKHDKLPYTGEKKKHYFNSIRHHYFRAIEYYVFI